MSSLDRGVVDILNDNKIVSRIMIDGGIAEINETSVVILAERAEKLDKSNRQIFEEKLLGFKSQENDPDKNVASMAVKNSSFIKAVLDNIN
jgi:F0F1-type ATP synthase epsilon subunit